VLDRLTRGESLPRLGGAVVGLAVVIALLWANLFPVSYQVVFTAQLAGIGGLSLRAIINQGLLTAFFALVGVEVRREFAGGSLSSWRRSAIPVVVALSGMIGPALCYLAVVHRGPALRGWCIPMATDVALSLAAFSLIQGHRFSPRARMLLLTFGTVDDILSVVVLLLVDPASLNVGVLALGLVAALGAIAFWMKGGGGLLRGLLLALAWVFVLAAGAEAALVGVLFGAFGPRREDRPVDLDRHLTPWVLLGVVPLFGLANAGVVISSSLFTSPVFFAIFLGVFLARVLGKPVGIFVGARMSRRVEHEGTLVHIGRRDLGGVAALAGIGFTVPLLMISVVFGAGPMASAAVVGLLAGLLGASMMGTVVLRVVGGTR